MAAVYPVVRPITGYRDRVPRYAPGSDGRRQDATQPGFLAHRRGDDVAIAVRDVAAGTSTVVYLDSGEREGNVAVEPIRLGHKVALRDLEEGVPVIEYGATIGITSTRVRAGELVHVHNLRSARWTRRS